MRIARGRELIGEARVANIGDNGGPPLEDRSLESPTVSLANSSAEDLLAFFGVAAGGASLPPVTIEIALEVPAILCAVLFLSRTLASLPLHAYRKADGEAKRIDTDLQMLLNEAPNAEWTSFEWRRYTWQQVFTGGRGVSWIERRGAAPVAIWPMDPSKTTVRRQGGRKVYRFGTREYSAADVIDVPWALKVNQLDAYSPIAKNKRAIGLMIAMADFAAGFFAGGGVPPLALEGPLPQGPDGFKRAAADIQRAIDNAKKAGQAFFGMPPGHKLSPIGTDPDKGEMTPARRFQVEEAGRIYQIPPVFLGDLTNGTFSNTEQQDLQLVKHCITHWVRAFEDECNLKLFGQRNRARYVQHSVDAIQRGSFKERIEGIARAIQTAQVTPNEARALEDRPPLPNGDKLYIQGATVPLGTQPVKPATGGGAANDDPGSRDPSDDGAA